MPTEDLAYCGRLSKPSSKVTVQRGGCGKQVQERGHLVKWYRNEDWVCYHAVCYQYLNLSVVPDDRT